MTWRSWLVLVLLALAGYLVSGLTQVRPGEVGVVRRLGQVVDVVAPGLHLGLPWGFGRVDRVAIDEQRQLNVGYVDRDDPLPDRLPVGQVLTADDQLLNLRITLFFRVDAAAVVEFVLNQERIEELMTRLAEETLVVALGGERASRVLLGQAQGLESQLQARLAARIRSLGLALRIDSVNIVEAQPPTELIEVYRQVNRARTQREILEREALGRKSSEISAGRQDASRIVADARPAGAEKRGGARAGATRSPPLPASLPADPAARQAALLNLYLTEMQAILPRMQMRTLSDQGVDQTIILPGAPR